VSLERIAQGPCVVTQTRDETGKSVVIVKPCFFISASTLLFTARQRKNGVPDYMRSKPDQ
jgi:hypothetical protein